MNEDIEMLWEYSSKVNEAVNTYLSGITFKDICICNIEDEYAEEYE